MHLLTHSLKRQGKIVDTGRKISRKMYTRTVCLMTFKHENKFTATARCGVKAAVLLNGSSVAEWLACWTQAQ